MISAEAAATIATAIIAALGGASIIPKMVDGVRAHLNKRARDEKQENRTLLGRAATAEARADREADYRRAIEAWGGELEYMLRQLGVPRDKIPYRPARPSNVKESAA